MNAHTAYVLGATARMHGQDKSHNPYSRSAAELELHRAWLMGHYEASSDVH